MSALTEHSNTKTFTFNTQIVCVSNVTAADIDSWLILVWQRNSKWIDVWGMECWRGEKALRGIPISHWEKLKGKHIRPVAFKPPRSHIPDHLRGRTFLITSSSCTTLSVWTGLWIMYSAVANRAEPPEEDEKGVSLLYQQQVRQHHDSLLYSPVNDCPM